MSGSAVGIGMGMLGIPELELVTLVTLLGLFVVIAMERAVGKRASARSTSWSFMVEVNEAVELFDH